MLEKNEQLITEINNLKSQELNLREQITKLETELNITNVCTFSNLFCNFKIKYND